MLTSEKQRLTKNGEFTLNAGGKLYGRTNSYFAESLRGTHHKEVVVRFDPEKLHETVYVYSLDG
ncbi:Mu transposase C-terminal domain-containing protein [[Haemophilus] ducreyi]|nr:Mu transposase C-terminal domain-containing protein [[Haemophilus] ducreyi]